MTWLKLSDDFTKDCRRARLTDSAFRLHVEGLNFAMDDENGGIFSEDDIHSFARAKDPMGCAQELQDAGFWQQIGPDTWQIIHQIDLQPDAEVLAARRANDAARQARKRRKDAGLPVEPASASRRESRRDTMRDMPRDVTRDPGRVGTGQDGTGQGHALEVTTDQGDSQTSPPSVPPQRGCGWCVGQGLRDGCPQCGRVSVLK